MIHARISVGVRLAPLLATLLTLPLSAQILYQSVEEGASARSHRFDVVHIAASIRFSESDRTVIGSVTHRIRSLDPALRSIRLDAGENMQIERLTVDGARAVYEHRGDTLDITLPDARAVGDTFSVAIDYRVQPAKGLYFIQPDSLEPAKRRQIWTQGEDEDTRYWLPCYDYPNDRATSELSITVPPTWQAVSNGRLVDVTQGSDGANIWHYKQEKPHASYLIMLAAGDYLVTRDTVDGVPLEYWSYPDMPERVRPTFARTPEMMRYFSKLLGVPYPWQKYAEVFIADFMYGGMENTTATTLNDYGLVDERGLLDYNPDGLLSHEMAHQWYGDLVTNRSWAHLWLHESFATYLEARFRGSHYGEDVLAKEMLDNGANALKTDATDGRNPIACGKGYTANIYDRGSRVLYMLNRMLGDEGFWRANKFYLQRHAYGVVETNDLKLAFEDALGINLDWFFDEWIYKAGAPAYRIDKSYDHDTLLLRVRQTQHLDSLTGLFRMPVPVEFHLHDRVDSTTIWVSKEDETFRFPLHEEPRFVIFDAGDAILKVVDFPRSEQEIIAQCSAPRMIDRLLAVRSMLDDSAAQRPVLERRARALRDAFMTEGSPFVRQAIVEKIAGMNPALAAEVTQKALGDTDVDVRHSAAEHAYVISDKRLRSKLLRPMLDDPSYGVVSAVLGMLAATDTNGLEKVLRKIKGTKSRRDRLAMAWLNAVTAGGFNSLADDAAEYTLPSYREETRTLAYFTLAKLTVTTPPIRAAILRGLVGTSTLTRAAAASAARAHMDAPMRAAIEHLRDTSTGEQREFAEKLLKN